MCECVCDAELTCGVVADDGVDEFVDVHQGDGDLMRLTWDTVDHLLTDGAEQDVARHVARRRKDLLVSDRINWHTGAASLLYTAL